MLIWPNFIDWYPGKLQHLASKTHTCSKGWGVTHVWCHQTVLLLCHIREKRSYRFTSMGNLPHSTRPQLQCYYGLQFHWKYLQSTLIRGEYYRLSIYRDYIWYDRVDSTTITLITHRSDLHSQIYTHTHKGEAWGVFRDLYVDKRPQYSESAL